MRVTRRSAIGNTGTEVSRSRSMPWLLAVVPIFCLALAPSAQAESARCGLSDPDTPIPGSSVSLFDTAGWAMNVSPNVWVTQVATGDLGFSCAASISTNGPTINVSIQGEPAHGQSLGAIAGVFIEYSIMSLQQGPGGMIPIIAQLKTIITFDDFNLTNGSMSLLNSFALTTNPDGITGANEFFSHVMNSESHSNCHTANGGCTFNDTLYGAAAVGDAQYYNWGASVAAFNFDGMPTTASVFADPVFMVDPDATFGDGQRYADYYEVVMPANITQTVIPVPAALPLFSSALAAFGFIGWRRRPFPRR